MSGYRGLLREFLRTGSPRALALQLRVGASHVARRWFSRGPETDPEGLFLENYAADGLRAPQEERRALQRAAQHCLVCGLCSVACAEAGGSPPLDPRDAVLSGARLEVDVRRLGIGEVGAACGACRVDGWCCVSMVSLRARGVGSSYASQSRSSAYAADVRVRR